MVFYRIKIAGNLFLHFLKVAASESLGPAVTKPPGKTIRKSVPATGAAGMKIEKTNLTHPGQKFWMMMKIFSLIFFLICCTYGGSLEWETRSIELKTATLSKKM